MSGEFPEEVARDQPRPLAVVFSKAVSVPPFNNSVEYFTWGKALVHSIAFFQMLKAEFCCGKCMTSQFILSR